MIRVPKILLSLVFLFACLPAFSQQGEGQQFQILGGASKLKSIRENLEKWDQSVLGFRREHQFSLMVGATRGKWLFKRFGSQVNKSHDDSGNFVKFRYTYHLQVWKSLGYFLGTSAGFWRKNAKPKKMDIQSIAMLPGIYAGLALNITPGFRLSGGVDYYLERWNALKDEDFIGEDPKISVTARAVDLMAVADIFYQLKWAFRIEFHHRDSRFRRPTNSAGKPVDAIVQRLDDWVGAGFLYHLM